MTKKLQRQLDSVLRHAERAQTYLDRKDIAVGYLNRPATTTLHYTRADGSTFYAVAKDYGSELCALLMAIRDLRFILASNEKPTVEPEHVA